MPYLVLQEFKMDGDDRSTTNYDAVSEHIGMATNPPDGMIIHTAGWDERPVSSESSSPDRDGSYELHNLISRG